MKISCRIRIYWISMCIYWEMMWFERDWNERQRERIWNANEWRTRWDESGLSLCESLTNYWCFIILNGKSFCWTDFSKCTFSNETDWKKKKQIRKPYSFFSPPHLVHIFCVITLFHIEAMILFVSSAFYKLCFECVFFSFHFQLCKYRHQPS